MNEHKNTISQSNHSALIISFRIKNHLSTEEICIICLFVRSVCLFLLDFVFALVFVLFSSSIRTETKSSIFKVKEPLSCVIPLTSI